MNCSNKEAIRREVLYKRLQLDEKKRAELDEAISNKLYEICGYYKKIYLYSAFKNEVDLTKLITKLITDGKEIFLPSIVEENIAFRRYEVECELSLGKYGILEPKGDISEPGEDSIIVIPAIAFDVRCNRVGYGAGYYDRYLADYQSVMKVGAIYDFQLVDDIDCDMSDIPVDIVITDKKEVRRRNQ